MFLKAIETHDWNTITQMACFRAYVYCILLNCKKWKPTLFSTGLHNSAPNVKMK